MIGPMDTPKATESQGNLPTSFALTPQSQRYNQSPEDEDAVLTFDEPSPTNVRPNFALDSLMDPPTISVTVEETKLSNNLNSSNSYMNRVKMFEAHHDMRSNDGEVSEDLEGSRCEVSEAILDESPSP